jgi:hypothetical protein
MKEQLIIKMVLDAWHQYLKRTDDLFREFTDEDLLKQIAPGKNSGKYLLGHLTAVHDRMLPLLGIGQTLFAGLHDDFETKADGDQVKKHSTTDLLRQWTEVNTTLNNAMATLTFEQWFERHTAISTEDFSKEPHRNRLNVIINRTNHIAWHYGQLILIKG